MESRGGGGGGGGGCSVFSWRWSEELIIAVAASGVVAWLRKYVGM